jgi:hypothetical protein
LPGTGPMTVKILAEKDRQASRGQISREGAGKGSMPGRRPSRGLHRGRLDQPGPQVFALLRGQDPVESPPHWQPASFEIVIRYWLLFPMPHDQR